MSEGLLKGLYPKYNVTRKEGETDPEADYFVLRLDRDPHARKAALCYAESIKEENRPLAFDIVSKVMQYEGGVIKKTEEKKDGTNP